ncbi:unnamed protein product, partial [marine sediment metagenome]
MLVSEDREAFYIDGVRVEKLALTFPVISERDQNAGRVQWLCYKILELNKEVEEHEYELDERMERR